jgi:20S proteasome alpha/beta subunit
MTCIVGLSDGKNVWMGGERGHSISSWIGQSTQPKVYKVGEYLIGYSGNAGIGQQMVYNFDFQDYTADEGTDPIYFLMTNFIPRLKKFFNKQNITIQGDEHEGELMIGFHGRVYEVNTGHMYCTEYKELCIGSGYAYAYGSLHNSGYLDPQERIEQALDAAIRYSPSCQGPVDLVTL